MAQLVLSEFMRSSSSRRFSYSEIVRIFGSFSVESLRILIFEFLKTLRGCLGNPFPKKCHVFPAGAGISFKPHFALPVASLPALQRAL